MGIRKNDGEKRQGKRKKARKKKKDNKGVESYYVEGNIRDKKGSVSESKVTIEGDVFVKQQYARRPTRRNLESVKKLETARRKEVFGRKKNLKIS